MNELVNLISSVRHDGNGLDRALLFFAVLLLAAAAGRLARHFFLRSARLLAARGRRLSPAVLEAQAGPVVFVAFLLGLRLAVPLLRLDAAMQAWANDAMGVMVVLAVGHIAYRMVDVVAGYLARPASHRRSRMDDMLAPMVRTSLRVTVVILVLLQIATLLSDKPLTSILAGLGVGGLAIALAAQDTVKNFFGSLVIFADKPFEMGDRVVVDGLDGNVEQVGFRSTRLRTQDGYLVTIPNGELANKTIQNIGKRPHIRRVMNLALAYDTPPAKLERAVAIVRELLHEHEGRHPAFPPQIFFNDFGATALNLSVTYWYHPADWMAYSAFSERVNLEILRRFNAEGIAFAFPAQTLQLAGRSPAPLI